MDFLNRAAIKGEARQFIGIDKKWWKMFLAPIFVYLLGGGISITVAVTNSLMHGGIQYYDDYYLKAKQLQNKYPNSFCWLYVNSFFQSPRQIHQLCDWVGIPKSNRYTDYICAINRKG